MKNIYVQNFKSPVGELILGSYGDSLCLCDWKYRNTRKTIDHRLSSRLKSNFIVQNSPVIEKAKNQLNEYFIKERLEFSIPLLTLGTDFQNLIWKALSDISYGTTISYLELACKIRNEKAVRAVASANGANALSIFIPCHRVIGSDGELTGYAGGINTKKKLLALEGL